MAYVNATASLDWSAAWSRASTVSRPVKKGLRRKGTCQMHGRSVGGGRGSSTGPAPPSKRGGANPNRRQPLAVDVLRNGKIMLPAADAAGADPNRFSQRFL